MEGRCGTGSRRRASAPAGLRGARSRGARRPEPRAAPGRAASRRAGSRSRRPPSRGRGRRPCPGSRARAARRPSAPGCGPDAVAIAPVTTITAQPTTPTSATSAEPAGRDRRPEPARVAPCLERDDDRERDDHEREQEVGHHRERMQVEDDRDAAERDLGDRPEEGRERGRLHPPGEPDDAPRREPGRERREDPDDSDDAVPELDHRVEVLRRERGRAAPRPVVAAEARAGEPDEGARRDDEPEQRRRADAIRRNRRDETGAREAAHGRLTSERHAASRLDPPTRGAASPAAANVASSTAPACRPAA